MLSAWLIVILSMTTSIVFFILSLAFPHLASDPGGPALFPQIMAVFTGFMSLALAFDLIRKDPGLTQLRASFADIGQAIGASVPAGSAPYLIRRSFFAVFASIFYPYAIIKAGFLAATVLFCLALMLMYKVKPLYGALYSSICGGLIFYVFNSILGAHVPGGEWADTLLLMMETWK